MLSIELAQGHKQIHIIMKVTSLLSIWCISFAVMVITCMSFSVVFWLSFIAFVLTSLYIGKNSKRLERELKNK